MAFIEIHSSQNSFLKKIEQLIKAPQKYSDDWLLEGVHLAQEGIKYLNQLIWTTSVIHNIFILISEESRNHLEVKNIIESMNILGDLKTLNIKIYQVSSRLFQEYSSVKPQILMLFPVTLKTLNENNENKMSLANHHVVLDGVQDPGNIGTIIRTCVAVGVNNLWCLKGTSYPFAPKVLRAAMGGHFHVNIYTGINYEELSARKNKYALMLKDAVSLYKLKLESPLLEQEPENYYWIFGSEGAGVQIEKFTNTQNVFIPQSSAVESLNVGVACSVVLYELFRQRCNVNPM